MGICGSVDMPPKAPLASPKRTQSGSQLGGTGSGRAADLFGAVQPPAAASASNQQGDGPAVDSPRNTTSGGGGYDRNSHQYGHHPQQQAHQSSRQLASNSHRQSSNHLGGGGGHNNQYGSPQQQKQHHQPPQQQQQQQYQSSSHRHQPMSPVRTADQAYQQQQQQSSRYRAASNDRHRAATDYRDDPRYRGESPRQSQRSHHQHSSHNHQQQADYYAASSSPRSSHGSSRFGSTRRKTYTVVPVTAENLQQHTRSYTTPKMHTVHDVIEEAVAEDKAARRSENFDMSEEELINYSEAGTKPFTMDRIPVKNDNGISSERSMARGNRRHRARTANSATSGTVSSTGSDSGYPSYETQDSYASNMPAGLHTPSYSRSRMRLLSQGSVGTVQSQFNGPIPAHSKGGGGIHAGSSSRLVAPGGNPHNSVSRSITDVPSIPEPHVAQHGRSNAAPHLHPQQQRVSSQHQLMSAPRAHTSPRHKSGGGGGRSSTPQPNGHGLEGVQQPHQGGGGGGHHLGDPRNSVAAAAAAATPTSMYAQHGDATPPQHNLSGGEYGVDPRSSPRHHHASYAAANGGGGAPIDSVAQPLNGHMNSHHNGGGQQQPPPQDFEKRKYVGM